MPAPRRFAAFLVPACACLCVLALARAQAPLPSALFDLVIIGGRVVDGTGAPWVRADIGITGDRIEAIGALRREDARTVINADGLIAAPGFIDMLGQSEFALLVDSRVASKVYQGVTTEITGEGSSIAPLTDAMAEDARPGYEHFGLSLDFRTLAEYFRRVETRARPTINIGTFVGAGGVRAHVMGLEDRRATPADLQGMRDLVAQAMRDGALGVSTSLQYVPGRFASTDELIALAEVAAAHGGIYITHQRSESGQIDASLDEVFAIAERARIPVEIWHLKVAYRPNWGRMPSVLGRIEEARARGLDVTADIYPYTRASNGLDACLPLWVREGGLEPMLARLRDPAQRERIMREMDDPTATAWENQWHGAGGGDGVMLASVLNPELRAYEGMTLTEIGRRRGKDPRAALIDLVIEDRGHSDCILAIMDERDVRAALVHPLVAIGTDSPAKAEDGPLAESKSHPRAWGSFPRILGHYVRDERLLPLEEAIRKMTSRPAARVGLHDRGIIRRGFKADVTLFDPAAIGVRHVIVNGRPVLTDGQLTTERPGQVLRGPGTRP